MSCVWKRSTRLGDTTPHNTKTQPKHKTKHKTQKTKRNTKQNTTTHKTKHKTKQHTTRNTQHTTRKTKQNKTTPHHTEPHRTTPNTPNEPNEQTTHNTQHRNNNTTTDTTTTPQQHHNDDNNNDNNNDNNTTTTPEQHDNNINNKAFDPKLPSHLCVFFWSKPKRVTMAFVARDFGSSAARRRRERRLRSWLRHERMTVRMELAAALHHSSFRGAGPETYDASRSQMTANSREDSVFFDLYDEDTEGARPDRLFEVRPQERDQRRTNWWRCGGSSMFAFPSRPSKCPRSHLHPVIAGGDGRTVGGSADDHILFFPIAADCGAERRYSSSWSWRAKRRSSGFSSQTEFNSAACFSGTQF